MYSIIVILIDQFHFNIIKEVLFKTLAIPNSEFLCNLKKNILSITKYVHLKICINITHNIIIRIITFYMSYAYKLYLR